MRVLAILAVIVAIVAGIYVAGPKHSSKQVAESKVAPDFTLADISGQKLNLASYKGKVVVLDFWATWCAPCRTEIPGFVQIQKKYGSQGAQVIGISMDDSVAPVNEFVRQYGVNYPIALGNGQIGQLYGGILGLPVTFVIDREGRIASKYVGETDLAKVEQDVQRLLAQKSDRS